ncbi:MAG: hypothetical protein K2X87_24300 [Gemmataceae bacterium]|nr:hypothetical protein [Gemmataceae bacterium]
MRRSRTARWAAAVVAAGLIGTTLPAQPPADLAAARERQKIADGKAEAVAKEAVREADRLAKTNKAKAAQVLRTAQADVDALGVSSESRKSLSTLLQAKLAILDGKPAPKDPAAKDDPTPSDLPAGDKATVLAAARAEVKEVREAVDHVKRLRDLGQRAEADRAAAALAAKYPNNPAVIFLGRRDDLGRAVAEAQDLAKAQSDAWVANANSVARSGIAAGNDVEFPKDWAEKTKRRTNKVELTAKEKALLEALDKPITLAAAEKPLKYVLQELSTAMDQQLVLDRKSLSDLNVDLEKPVSVDARGLSARTVLRQVLGGEGLTFLVKDQLIQVMTVERARDQLATKVYYLGDLVQGVGPFAGPFTWGPAVDFEQTLSNVRIVVDAIKSSIDPEVWKNGFASITFHLPSMSLIVRAPSEVHASLGSKLGAGR